ncbi:MAG TPA: hypothetical protein VFL92_06985 [Sphingomonas sp.]|nr:hypothetical protein [Sphingomonas sp.]
MSDAPPVAAPAGYIPEHAMAFADPAGRAIGVTEADPLPVAARLNAARSTPLAGSCTASGVFGPFAPELGRPIWVSLSGDWTGSARLLRSADGASEALPLTVGGQPACRFTASANEPCCEETAAGATYFLAVTLGSGTLDYRVAQ